MLPLLGETVRSRVWIPLHAPTLAPSNNICGLASLVAGVGLAPTGKGHLATAHANTDSIGVLSVQQDREKDGKSRSVLRKELFLAY
jgi:hypothetical protein